MTTKMLVILAISAASLSGCIMYPRHGHGYGESRNTDTTYIYDNRGNRQNGSGRDSSDYRGHRHGEGGDGWRNRYDRDDR